MSFFAEAIVFLAALTVTSMAGAQARSTTQMPDIADSIVFTDGFGSASEIYTRSSQGTVRRLTRNRMSESLPAWAPDRRRIAFVRNGDIWVMKSDGTGARRCRKQR